MIEVVYNLTPYEMEDSEMSLSVKGHAGYAEEGSDIVCAAASILFQTFAAWLRVGYESGILSDPPEIVQKKGEARVAFIPPKETRNTWRELLAMIVNGYRLLEAAYPENVIVSERE